MCQKAAVAAQDVHSFYREWRDMDAGILLGIVFLWGMQNDMDMVSTRWWCEFLSSEPRGRAILRLHDWAVAIQKARRVHDSRLGRLPYWGPRKDPGGMQRLGLPVCPEVTASRGNLLVKNCTVMQLRAFASSS